MEGVTDGEKEGESKLPHLLDTVSKFTLFSGVRFER